MSIFSQYFLEIHNDGVDNTHCRDHDNGATDIDGDSCETWYNMYPEDCGSYDDDDFVAKVMCCSCRTFGKFMLSSIVQILFISVEK